jgi:hypothetical protein
MGMGQTAEDPNINASTRADNAQMQKDFKKAEI